jgi:RimJ/RimL family protein N-acetyltransferase
VANSFRIRGATEPDRLPLARLFAAVAEERDGIAAEPPVDVERRAARWNLDATLVAETAGELIGALELDDTGWGFAELGMFVAREWRGRGVGSALLAAAIDQARDRGLHKLSLGVFPHNEAGLALYRKFGFVEEGRRLEHIARQNGEHWDLIDMGLRLADRR